VPNLRLLSCVFVLMVACKPDDAGGTAFDTAGSTGATGSTGIVVPTTGSSSGTGEGSSGAATTTSTSSATTTTGDPGTTTFSTTGGGAVCGGKVYKCADGMDNDGDGKTDLDDPECTGPCDDAEDSFQTGIPGDNVDCKQDCFFDGNSGQGEGCTWDLKCDPANPGEAIGCAYTGGKNCAGMTGQTDQCKMNCEPYVPNGCDCFGCCTISTPNGDINIFLNSSPDCSLLNLDACAQCTPQIDDCGNDCDPDNCEVCFGGELPPGCDMPGGCEVWEPPCPNGQADCPDGLFCVTGCCIAPPQG